MAGENCENLDPDYDGSGFGSANIEELNTLLETLDVEGSQDWALQRECEILRLERENEELRRLLGIDDANMAARGVSVDQDRVESGRYSTLLSSSSRRRPSSDNFNQKSSYWDNNSQPLQQQQQQPPQLQQPAPAAPSQRTIELQPGMRAGPQARRAGMFGAGHQRGFLGGVGRAMAIGVGTPGSSSPGWSNPGGGPGSPPITPTTDRLWQPQASASTTDLLR